MSEQPEHIMSNQAVADLTEAKLHIEADLCSIQRKAMRLLVEPVEGEEAEQLRIWWR